MSWLCFCVDSKAIFGYKISINSFYHWLLIASLKGFLVLPLAWFAASISRRTSSAVICLMLAVCVLAVPFTPFVDQLLPTLSVRIPALEATGAFSGEVPGFLAFEQRNPLPGQPGDLLFENESGPSISTVVVVLWALGTIIFLSVRFWGTLNVRLRYANSVPLAGDHPSARIMNDLVADMEMKHAPWLLLNPHIRGAQTSGVVRPAILVPASFEDMEHAQQAMVLRHELAHIQRRDVLIRILMEIVAVVFWFHPLIWFILKRYDFETEKACDDAVLHGGYSASAYSETLLSSARSCRATGKASTVKGRIAAILLAEKHRQPLKPRSALGFLFLLLLVIFAVSRVTFTPYPAMATFEVLESNPALRALWKMNLNRGTIVPDWSGNDRHGKIYGAKWVTDPERGACLSFDGKEDHLVLRAPDADWTRKPFSLCIWLKPAADADGGGLLLKGDHNNIWSHAFGNSPDGQSTEFSERQITLGGGEFGGSGQEMMSYQPGLHPILNYHNLAFRRSEKPLPTNEWTHLAIVWIPRAAGTPTSHMYYNGEAVEVDHLYDGHLPNLIDWPTELWFFARGESLLDQDNHYEGLASELAIYQKALSPEEVKAVMQGDYERVK